MADTKISALPSASTPLTGAEVLPIVQGAGNFKVSVADLTAGRAIATGAITSSSLTATRVLFAGTAGLIQDDADLTFNGTILTSTGFAGPLNGTVGATTANTGAFTTLTTSSTVTLSGGTANGVPYLNGSKVLTTGSALTFDGTTLVGNAAYGTGTAALILKNTSAAVLANIVEQQFWAADTFTGLTQKGAFGLDTTTGVGNQYGSFYWKLSNAGAPTEQMRLTTSGLEVKQSQLIGYSSYAGLGSYGLAVAGNVGIGTISPRTKFDVLLSGTANTGGSLAPSLALFTGPGLEPITDGSRAGANVNIESNTAQGANVGASLMFGGRYVNSSTVSTGFGAIYGAKENGTSNDLAGYLAFYTNRSGVTTKAMTIDSSGNLGLGVTPSAWFASAKAMQVSKYANVSANIINGYGSFACNAYESANGIWNYIEANPASLYQNALGAHIWKVAPSWNGTGSDAITFTQAMTLDASGNLLVGTTVALYAAGERVSVQGASGKIGQTIQATGASSIGLLLASDIATGATSAKQISFVNSGGVEVGSVTSNGTATLFNTTSDQRLKENIQDAAPASALIDAIQVREYDWKSGGSHQRYGFIAQELVTVAPEAVHQPANPEEMMAVDYSKLVPMLVKEIQSLRKRLAAAGI